MSNYFTVVLKGDAFKFKYNRKTEVQDKIKKFNENNKLIAAICSGTMMLISAKITKNKNISGYYAWKDDIENSGAIFIDEPAVVDQNIVTSPHYKYVGPWMKLALKTLKDLKE